MRTNRQNLHDIGSSLRQMQELLHVWDGVRGEIGQTLVELERAGQTPEVDETRIREFAEKRDALRPLVEREIADNIDNLETGEVMLKTTALGGLAIPTLAGAVYFAPVFTSVLGEGLLTGATMVGTGALLNGAAGAVLNGVGQLFAPRSSFSDGWEMTKAHAQWGAAAGSAGTLGVLQKSSAVLKWTTALPAGLAAGSTALVVYAGRRQTVGPFDNLDKPLAMEYPVASYLSSVRRFNDENTDGAVVGIGPQESRQLFDAMRASHNPEIEFVYSQIVSGGSFVTLNRGQGNFCLNFSDKDQMLPCEIGSARLFRHSGVSMVNVSPNFTIRLNDKNRHKEFEKEMAAFGIHRPILKPDEGMKLIAEHIGDASLVGYLIPKIYRGIFLPETASAVTYLLFNLFLKSEAIGPDAKIFYARLMQEALREYGALFKQCQAYWKAKLSLQTPTVQRMEGVGLVEIRAFQGSEDTPIFFSTIREEGAAVERAWVSFAPAGRSGKEALQSVFADWNEIQYRLFMKEEKGVSRYERSIEEAYVTMQQDYLERVRGAYDIWRDASGAEGAVGGWLLSDLTTRSDPNLGVRVLWAASGYLTYLNLAAAAENAKTPLPVDLRLPQMSGLVPQAVLEDSDKTAAGQK